MHADSGWSLPDGFDADADLLANARQLFAQGDLNAQNKLFLKLKDSRATPRTPIPVTPWFLLKREDFAASLRFFEDALSKRIENADAYYGIGIILLRKGNSLGPRSRV